MGAISEDVSDLATEAVSIDALVEKLTAMVSKLIALNDGTPEDYRGVLISLSSQCDFKLTGLPDGADQFYPWAETNTKEGKLDLCPYR